MLKPAGDPLPTQHRGRPDAERRTRHAGRPPLPDDRDTRTDILTAARVMFADLGYERTTMRAVAGRAGVDVALIYHHFGSKNELLTAVIGLPTAAQPLQHSIPAGTPEPGRAVARVVIDLWENNPPVRQQALAMIRTALSHDQAMRRLNDLHQSFVLTLIADVVTDDDRELRAALIGAHLTGLLLHRYLFHIPALTAADPTILIDATAHAIDHYLTGHLTPHRGDPGRARVTDRLHTEQIGDDRCGKPGWAG